MFRRLSQSVDKRLGVITETSELQVCACMCTCVCLHLAYLCASVCQRDGEPDYRDLSSGHNQEPAFI